MQFGLLHVNHFEEVRIEADVFHDWRRCHHFGAFRVSPVYSELLTATLAKRTVADAANVHRFAARNCQSGQNATAYPVTDTLFGLLQAFERIV